MAAVRAETVRYRTIRRVTLVGSAVDLALGVAKLIGGWLAHSHALVADGVHSMSDLATDIMVLYAAKHADAQPDEDHPYGHRRIETLATVGLAAVLILIAIGIAYDAVRDLLAPETLAAPAGWAMWIAAVSVAAKEWVYQYSMRYARSLDSDLLVANAWHARSDAASSLVVIVGVAGTMVGLVYLDAVASVIVAWMIARIGYKVGRQGAEELIDTGLDPDRLDEIRELILGVDGVADLHQLRTRQMGGISLVDVHIILTDGRLSVSEGHQISETVRARLIRRLKHVEDVTVHIDPEDDEAHPVPPGQHLALRTKVVEHLDSLWRDVPAWRNAQHITLHYLDGRVHVDVELPLEVLDRVPATDLKRHFEASVADDPDIGEVRLLFH